MFPFNKISVSQQCVLRSQLISCNIDISCCQYHYFPNIAHSQPEEVSTQPKYNFVCLLLITVNSRDNSDNLLGFPCSTSLQSYNSYFQT